MAASFQNMATLTYTGGTVDSNIVTGELREVLTVVKTAVNKSYELGGRVTYVISLSNSGTVALTGLTLTDDLGGYAFGGTTLYPLAYVEGSLRYFQNGVLQDMPAVVAGPPMTVTGVTVPAGGSALVVYETAVTRYTPMAAESTVTNTVTVTVGGLAEAVTFTIQNRGNTAVTAADDVTLRDVFKPILKNITVTYNGTAWSAGTEYTYSETTGEFVSAVGQITVPAATYTQDPVTGVWSVTPGSSVLVITGTV